MTKKNRIRRSLGWKAAANVILIAVIIGATAVCISYRAYRQNLEDQMTQTAENLSRAAAAQVTAERASTAIWPPARRTTPNGSEITGRRRNKKRCKPRKKACSGAFWRPREDLNLRPHA